MSGLMRSSRVMQWTRERIDALTTVEVRQLRANAQRLGEAEIATLCDQILDARPRSGGPRKAKAKTGAGATKTGARAAKAKP